jgi:hypothetical protein
MLIVEVLALASSDIKSGANLTAANLSVSTRAEDRRLALASALHALLVLLAVLLQGESVSGYCEEAVAAYSQCYVAASQGSGQFTHTDGA